MIYNAFKFIQKYQIPIIGILSLIFFIFAFFVADKKIIFADGVGYFSYPFELYHSGDLLYGDKNSSTIFGVTRQNGVYVNKYPIGTGIFLVPALIFGEIFNNRPTHSVYDPSYQFFTGVFGIVILCLGLIILNRILLRFFDKNISTLTLLIITFGTNLIIYASTDASFSHIYSFFSINLFILYTIKWHGLPTKLNTILLATSFAMCILIRQSNIIILLIFLLYDIDANNLRSSLTDKLSFYKKNFSKLLLISGVILLLYVPQLIYWLTITGHLVYFAYSNEHFDFLRPQIATVLFNESRGAILYHPIYIFILSGFYFIRKTIPKLFLGITIFSIINLYIISSWWYPDYGIGFGHRGFTDFLGIFAILLASALYSIHTSKDRMLRRLFYLIIAIQCLANIFLSIRYIYQ